MFAPKKLLFRLELNGKLLYEVYSDDVKSDITIGRSRENVWIIPEEDCSASSRHAKIVFKNKSFCLEDTGSRNGVYYQGERIREKKLVHGDLFSIGDCKLTIENVVEDKSKKTEEEFHKFEQLSGKSKGHIYRLTEDSIKIGSSSGCGIVIDDTLVSHIHAIVENHKDGTCWVKDMKSRNGTKVNGSLLTEENAETGRMLKDGDIVSIAYVDFRFWDKNVMHIRSHLFLKIGVITATLAIAIGGYFAFQAFLPSAKKIRLQAEAYAARGDFMSAQEILQSAVTARGADDDAEQRLELSRKLKIWKNTLETWNKIRKLLTGSPGEGALYKASDLFGVLVAGNREAWQWNAVNAASEMKKAQETQQFLSALLGTEDWLNKSKDDIEYMKNLVDKLTAVAAVCQKNPQPYQAVLFARAKDIIEEMQLEIKEYNETLAAINAYKSSALTAEIIGRLEKIKVTASARLAVRKKAGKISSNIVEKQCEKNLTPLYKLQNSQKLLDANYAYIAEFDFAKFRENILLPGSEECIVASNLALRRAEMEKSNFRLKTLSVQLKNYQLFFRNQSLFPTVKSQLLSDIFDEGIWKKVLACDCLNFKQPAYSDKKWVSVYDKTLGVYVFWEFLRSVGGEFDSTIFEERFKPDLFRSKEIFNHLEVFISFCNPSPRLPHYGDMKRLLGMNYGNNKLAAHRKIAQSILQQRTALSRQMYETYRRYPESRNGIIAGGVAFYLEPEKSRILPQNIAEMLSKSLKNLRKNLTLLSQQNNDAAPEQIIRNEKKMLELGIPGDSFLKQPWTDHVKRK